MLAGCGGKDEKPAPLPDRTVTVDTVAQRDLAGGLTASGRFQAMEEIAVSADLPGYRVARVFVEEGAFVRQGQVLAQLDDSLLRSQIAQARAQVVQQQVAVEETRAQAGRVAGLDGQGVLSNEALDARRFATRKAAAAVAATRAQLADLETRNAHLAIRAPSDGVVIERTVRPGDTAGTASMFRLARSGLMEFYAELSEGDLALVRVGEDVEASLPSGGTTIGTVRFISPRIDPGTGTGTVRVLLPRSADLRPGGHAIARFLGGRTAPAVPEAAVNYGADGAHVWVIGKDDRARRVGVQTGLRARGLVELRQGPPPGSRVAIAGAAFLLDGDKVRLTARGN
jgi:HlyD family secretion protein